MKKGTSRISPRLLADSTRPSPRYSGCPLFQLRRLIPPRPFTALSLFLCVVCLIGWVRSQYVGDELGRLWRRDEADVRLLRGVSFAHGRGVARLWILRIEQEQPATITAREEWVYSPHPLARSIVESAQPIMGIAGYGWVWQDEHSYWLATSTHTSGVILPYWLLLALVAAAPLYRAGEWCVRRYVGGRRRAGGRCPACGYDLRESAGRCPECGKSTKCGLGVSPERSGETPKPPITLAADDPS